MGRGNVTRNFAYEFNKLIVCKEFGYTEEEYDSNSIEFNIMAGYFLEAESKATKAHTPNIPKPRAPRTPRTNTFKRR